jgi:GDPmannose 4,6-dehydratase
MKTAVITGILGQDGSLLADLLLSKQYKVIGVHRRYSNINKTNISHISDPNFILIEGDITDPNSVREILREYKPDEFYNLAAQSHVGTSFKQPDLTMQINATGVLNCLEAIKSESPETRFYQASTSEMFGSNISYLYCPNSYGIDFRYDGKLDTTCISYQKKWSPVFQDEYTPFKPESPYGVSKVAAHEMVGLYRRSYGIHASAGILFNHESEHRGEQFVTRKVTKWLANFLKEDDREVYTMGRLFPARLYKNRGDDRGWPCPPNLDQKLKLGDLSTLRDFGYAREYVEAMWLMLQQDEPDDYVIATGKTYTIEDFVKTAFSHAGINKWENYVNIDSSLFRPSEVKYLCGNASKAEKKLGWKAKTTMDELALLMLRYDFYGSLS